MQTFLLGDGEIVIGKNSLNFFNEKFRDLNINLETNLEQLVPKIFKGP